jgi:serine/threonine protein kinase
MVKRKTKKGGAFISQGTYGCVFGKPPLKCNGEARRTNRYVSKLTDATTAKHDTDKIDFLRSIDPYEEAFIIPIDSCKFNVSSVLPTNGLDKCDLLKKQRMGVVDTLLFSKYGGKYLHDLKLPHTDYLPFFESLLPLLQGLKKLHDRGFSHCDIKDANILTEKQRDNTFKTRFIDFDLLSHNDELVTSTDKRDTFKTIYAVWPIELFFASADGAIPDSFIERKLNAWYMAQRYTNVYKSFPGNSYFTYGENKKFTAASPEIQALRLDYNTYSLSYVDIFSFGVVLSHMYSYLLKHVLQLDSTNNEVYIIDKIDDIVLLKTNKKEVEDWHNTIIEHVSFPLHRLIKAMVNINAIRRININQVLEGYTRILENMRKYFIPADLDKYLPPNKSGPSSYEYMSPLPPPTSARSRSRSRSRATGTRATGRRPPVSPINKSRKRR